MLENKSDDTTENELQEILDLMLAGQTQPDAEPDKFNFKKRHEELNKRHAALDKIAAKYEITGKKAEVLDDDIASRGKKPSSGVIAEIEQMKKEYKDPEKRLEELNKIALRYLSGGKKAEVSDDDITSRGKELSSGVFAEIEQMKKEYKEYKDPEKRFEELNKRHAALDKIAAKYGIGGKKAEVSDDDITSRGKELARYCAERRLEELNKRHAALDKIAAKYGIGGKKAEVSDDDITSRGKELARYCAERRITPEQREIQPTETQEPSVPVPLLVDAEDSYEGGLNQEYDSTIDMSWGTECAELEEEELREKIIVQPRIVETIEKQLSDADESESDLYEEYDSTIDMSWGTQYAELEEEELREKAQIPKKETIDKKVENIPTNQKILSLLFPENRVDEKTIPHFARMLERVTSPGVIETIINAAFKAIDYDKTRLYQGTMLVSASYDELFSANKDETMFESSSIMPAYPFKYLVPNEDFSSKHYSEILKIGLGLPTEDVEVGKVFRAILMEKKTDPSKYLLVKYIRGKEKGKRMLSFETNDKEYAASHKENMNFNLEEEIEKAKPEAKKEEPKKTKSAEEHIADAYRKDVDIEDVPAYVKGKGVNLPDDALEKLAEDIYFKLETQEENDLEDSIKSYYDAGMAAMKEGNYETAVNSFERFANSFDYLAEKVPDICIRDAMYELGKSLMETKYPIHAITRFRQSLRMDKTNSTKLDSRIHRNLGICYKTMGDNENAINAFKQAVINGDKKYAVEQLKELGIHTNIYSEIPEFRRLEKKNLLCLFK